MMLGVNYVCYVANIVFKNAMHHTNNARDLTSFNHTSPRVLERNEPFNDVIIDIVFLCFS